MKFQRIQFIIILMLLSGFTFTACGDSSDDSSHCTVTNTKVWDFTVDDTTDPSGNPLEGEDDYLYKPDTPNRLTVADTCDKNNNTSVNSEDTIFVQYFDAQFQRYNETEGEWQDWIAVSETSQAEQPESIAMCEDYWTGFHYQVDFNALSMTRTDVWYLPTSCDCDENIRAGNRSCNPAKWND